MHLTISKVCLALAGAAILSAPPAQAQVVIVDNLTQPIGLPGNDNGLGNAAAAQEFMTDGTTRLLTSVTVALIGNPGDSLTVSLDSLTISPTSNDFEFHDLLNLGTAAPTSNASYADITLIAPTPFTLAANTSYWIVGQYNGVPGWGWTGDSVSPGSNTASGVGTLGDYAQFYPGDWFLGQYPPPQWYLGQYSPYLVEVQASNVPEPGASALFASLGLTGAAFLRRRRLKALQN